MSTKMAFTATLQMAYTAFLIGIAAGSLTEIANAKKPDWPGGGGSGVIGFGLIELTPQKKDGAFAETEFTFNYDVPAKYSRNLSSGQIVVLPASAAEQYNDIPSNVFLAHVSAKKLLPDADFHMSAIIKISTPGLYIVAYGPWDGLLTFDNTDGREAYKISADAPAGGAMRWIDQDAGDITIMNFPQIPNAELKDTILRIRLLRDKKSLLQNSSMYEIAPLKLNPLAAERVKLIDANW
jgi:hypothetical protein